MTESAFQPSLIWPTFLNNIESIQHIIIDRMYCMHTFYTFMLCVLHWKIWVGLLKCCNCHWIFLENSKQIGKADGNCVCKPGFVCSFIACNKDISGWRWVCVFVHDLGIPAKTDTIPINAFCSSYWGNNIWICLKGAWRAERGLMWATMWMQTEDGITSYRQ